VSVVQLADWINRVSVLYCLGQDPNLFDPSDRYITLPAQPMDQETTRVYGMCGSLSVLHDLHSAGRYIRA
jgi:hypothetical protein